jgi:hypothetical protein
MSKTTNGMSSKIQKSHIKPVRKFIQRASGIKKRTALTDNVGTIGTSDDPRRRGEGTVAAAAEAVAMTMR